MDNPILKSFYKLHQSHTTISYQTFCRRMQLFIDHYDLKTMLWCLRSEYDA